MGFSMLGRRWHAATLISWIEQGRTLPWVLRNLHQASFDEELSRDPLRGGRHA